MRDNSLEHIKIKDIETGVPVTLYFGYNGTRYTLLKDPMGFESEPMKITVTINYHEKIRTFKNAFINVDEEDKYLMVDAINIKMGMYNRHIDVDLEPELGEKNAYQGIYLWGCPYDASLLSIGSLMFVIEKCWHVLSEMNVSRIMSCRKSPIGFTRTAILLRKSIIHGIVTSMNQELAERCLEYCCRYIWDDIDQEFFDTCCVTVYILIEELVNNRPELLRMIPLCLRIMLITHFNAEGKHEIVAALNHYHRGDYKDPRKDLML